jgi:hypothetical protein
MWTFRHACAGNRSCGICSVVYAFRGAFLNFFGKAAFGYFGCPAIAQPLQDSRRPTS